MSWCGTRSPRRASRARVRPPRNATGSARRRRRRSPRAGRRSHVNQSGRESNCAEKVTLQAWNGCVGQSTGLHSHRPVLVALQLTALTIVLVFFYWAFRTPGTRRNRSCARPTSAMSSSPASSSPRTTCCSRSPGSACSPRGGSRSRTSWRSRPEMASILAKYVPGTVWIPAARIASALRRLRHPRDAPDPRLDADGGRAIGALGGDRVHGQPCDCRVQLGAGAPAASARVDRGGGAPPESLHAGIRRLLRPFGGGGLPAPPLLRRWSGCSGTTRFTVDRWRHGASTSCFGRSAALRRSRTSRTSAAWPRSRRSWRFSR